MQSNGKENFGFSSPNCDDKNLALRHLRKAHTRYFEDMGEFQRDRNVWHVFKRISCQWCEGVSCIKCRVIIIIPCVKSIFSFDLIYTQPCRSYCLYRGTLIPSMLHRPHPLVNHRPFAGFFSQFRYFLRFQYGRCHIVWSNYQASFISVNFVQAKVKACPSGYRQFVLIWKFR